MTYVTVSGIGPAERRVVELILDDIIVADRDTVQNVKRLRKQLDLRGLRLEIDDLIAEEKKRLIADGMSPAMLSAGPLAMTWGALIEAGYFQPETGGAEEYGRSYQVDRATLIWLQDKRIKKETWAWRSKPGKPGGVGETPEREPTSVGPELLDAIATLDEAMEVALGKTE